VERTNLIKMIILCSGMHKLDDIPAQIIKSSKEILILSIKQHILVKIEYNKGIDEEEYILFTSKERRRLV